MINILKKIIIKLANSRKIAPGQTTIIMDRWTKEEVEDMVMEPIVTTAASRLNRGYRWFNQTSTNVMMILRKNGKSLMDTSWN